VRVGQTTVIVGDSIRTGVTAILPHPGNLFLDRVPAAIYVGNGFGKLLGSTQVAELGELDVRSIAAIKEASGGPVAEGSVGAGTGTVAFGWKGGIGSSSRLTGPADSRWTVGVLVQTNFGGDLHIMGVPVSRALHRNIAFSTHRDVRRRNGESRRSVAELDNDAMSGIFQAVVDATEEATLRSRHGTVHALPVAEVLGILRQHGALR
jgi:D-aminopeptidase